MILKIIKNRCVWDAVLLRFAAVAASVVLGLLYVGCDSFVEVEMPAGHLASPQIFEEAGTADAAMTEVYAKMRDDGMLSGNPAGFSYTLGLYADELDFYAGSEQGGFGYYSNSLLAQSTGISSLWNASYRQIYGANAVIYGVTNSATLAQGDRDRLKGEALFVRALLHSMLSGAFGSVPYIATTDYQQNRSAVKLPAADVLLRAKLDLEEAAVLLPEEYMVPDRTRPNRFAAEALLARLCLYLGEWEEASSHASAVIGASSMYGMDTDFAEAFRIGSAGTIFQFSPGFSGTNTLEAQTFTFVSGPPTSIALSPGLLDAFEPGDLRRAQWVREVAGGSGSWYHARKYRETASAVTQTEFSKVLRLGETYLIRAEARARLGLVQAAGEDLNAVRHFAGLGDTPAASSEQLLLAVLQERRVELFTEFGHRFFDLKRYGQLDAVLGGSKPGWDAHDSLFPLPESELLLNPNLNPQNSGF